MLAKYHQAIESSDFLVPHLLKHADVHALYDSARETSPETEALGCEVWDDRWPNKNRNFAVRTALDELQSVLLRRGTTYLSRL